MLRPPEPPASSRPPGCREAGSLWAVAAAGRAPAGWPGWRQPGLTGRRSTAWYQSSDGRDDDHGYESDLRYFEPLAMYRYP